MSERIRDIFTLWGAVAKLLKSQKKKSARLQQWKKSFGVPLLVSYYPPQIHVMLLFLTNFLYFFSNTSYVIHPTHDATRWETKVPPPHCRHTSTLTVSVPSLAMSVHWDLVAMSSISVASPAGKLILISSIFKSRSFRSFGSVCSFRWRLLENFDLPRNSAVLFWWRLKGYINSSPACVINPNPGCGSR